MRRFILARLVGAIATLAGVAVISFVLLELAPGDTCDALLSPDLDATTRAAQRLEMGCDAPAAKRAVDLLARLATLDLGVSSRHHRPVAAVIADALPATVLLAGMALLVGTAAGLAAGMAQAARHRRTIDRAIAAVTIAIQAAPAFLVGLALVVAFSSWWPVLPSSGAVDVVLHDGMSTAGRFLDRARHLVLPVSTLALGQAALVARFARASLLDVLAQDHVRTARAAGLPESRVLLAHVLPNALLPLVALLGVELPALVSGSVLVENVFAWPGMGRVIVSAILAQDPALVSGCFLVYGAAVVVGSLAADLLSAWIDPRVRLSR